MKRLFSILVVCMLNAYFAVASAYNINVEVTPNGAGSLNRSSGTYDEGSSVYLQTYNNTGYVFKGWYEGDSLVSSSTGFYYTMPARDVIMQARYEYDPSVPTDPAMPDTATYYTLTATISPTGAGSLNISGGRYAANSSVYLRAYTNSYYRFVEWQDEQGESVSTSSSFYYTMPNHDAQLTAVYEYDPDVPADPDSMATKYSVRVVSKPNGGGSFNNSNFTAAEGSAVSLYAYTNTGYEFKHWENESGEVIATTRNFSYVIPHGDSQLYGVFEYNPAPPSNPGKNYWNKETGEVVVDDFNAGYLSSAISSTLNGSSSSDVTMITVAGKMNSNDFGIANNYSNCTMLDLSRVTGVTEVPSYAFDYTNLVSVSLPATIERIGYRAFEECASLTSVTCYSLTPPTVENYVFNGVPEGLVVYVPAGAIAQYQEADVWKDFTILPIQDEVSSVTVAMPEDIDIAQYKQMWLELINTKSGQRIHYVITDRLNYTFSNIIKKTAWNVVLRSERGDVFGQINNVEVADEDVVVTFESLSVPQNTTIVVKTPDGIDVTSKMQIAWTDSLGNYMSTGNGISGLPAGFKLVYKLTMDRDLTMKYVIPSEDTYIVQNEGNDVTVVLEPIAQVTLSGVVKNKSTDALLSGVAVSASQTFGGKYSNTVIAKTGGNGEYSLVVYNVPTVLTFSATDYVSQTLNCDTLLVGSEQVTIPDVTLKSITGATISLAFTYTSSVIEGETADVQNSYSGYNNIDYTIINKTKNKAITQFNVQYPKIVLLEEVETGDELQLTATSRTNSFVPVVATAVMNEEQNVAATFSIVELGKIQSKFTATANAYVVASLYDAKGKFVKSYDYSNATLTISDLADGNYTLITMGSSHLFNAIYNLSQLEETGLARDKDYIQSEVVVKSGEIATVSIDKVPLLDESKLYYTGDNTMFTVNKTSIVIGNYLTMTGKLDFKSAYSANVKNVQLIVDIPDGCSFVENSVMVGNSIGSYALNDGKLTIPMARYTDRVRFCIIPIEGGEHNASAYVRFELNGEIINQPIGSANYVARNLSITVPSIVAKTRVPVSGTAIGSSTVEVYDNDVLIGQTTSLANGVWSMTCDLLETTNLSTHYISAVTTTKTGLVMRSEVKECIYDKNAIEAAKVTMINTAHPASNLNTCEYVTVFDFQNPPSSIPAYWYWPSYPKFTFLAELTSDLQRVISNVYINVFDTKGDVHQLKTEYDEKSGYWIVAKNFDSYALPKNVSVNVDYMKYDLADTTVYEAIMDELIGEITIERDSLNADTSLIKSQFGDSLASVIERERDISFEDAVSEYQAELYTEELREDGVAVYSSDSSLTILVNPATGAIGGVYELTIRLITLENKRVVVDSILDTITREWNTLIYSRIDCNAGLLIQGYSHNVQTIRKYAVSIIYTILVREFYNKWVFNDLIEHSFRKYVLGTLIRHKEQIVHNMESTMYEVMQAYDCTPPPPPVDPVTPEVPHVMDPSGYVYEGVPSNRLEGVTATAFYKETVEDMYGDKHENIVKWDATEYDQENPLFTDQYGMYAWDVPNGLWQVKFEKEGYETTYSEWLPVPPPQLEVNIPMVQKRQPEVVGARAYEEGIEVEFDKYMQIETLTTDNILLTRNGAQVEGTLILLNEEVSDDSETTAYASKVRFVPNETFLTTDDVVLTVSKNVKSYAGVQMEADYTQSFDIEKEVKSLSVDSVAEVGYNGAKTLVVSAVPYDAAIGKKLVAMSSSNMIIALSADTLTFNEDGQAEIVVSGELPGAAAVTYKLVDADVAATTRVNVIIEADVIPAKPTSTRASGSSVYRNSQVILSCDTKDAVIYYTIDGSCPCDENGSRMVYLAPIVIDTDSVTIKAMAINEDGVESEVAEFYYTLMTTASGMALKEGWNWVSHSVETDISVDSLKTNADRIVSRTQELVNDPNYGFVGNLKSLSPQEMYKVHATADAEVVLRGYAFNPAYELELNAGWNWIGFPLDQVLYVDEAFANAEPQEGDYITGRDGFAEYYNGAWVGELATLSPGSGYMYKANAAMSFAYNHAIVSKAKAQSFVGKSSSAPWAVDKSKYPNIMCLVADLYVDGTVANADEYYVGAFCGTECRGIGKYVQGRLMMSIYGTGGEYITFIAMDAEDETLYNINETTTFSETKLGSMANPYYLNIGGETTNIAGIDTGCKVWPTVASTEVFVSGKGTLVDQVMLTSMSGTTVLSERNVPNNGSVNISSLPEGVYVVTVVSGGNTFYQKIVKTAK